MTFQTVSPVYSITTFARFISSGIGSSYIVNAHEGDRFSITFGVDGHENTTTVYYSLSGNNITESDFDSGNSSPLTGSFDASISAWGYKEYLSYTLAKDMKTEGTEWIDIKLFSDSSFSTQVGSTKSISISDTSQLGPIEKPSPVNSTDGDDYFLPESVLLSSWSSVNNYEIDGGLGNDVVRYWGYFSDYSFVRTNDYLEIRKKQFETVSFLKNIEFIDFNDQRVEVSKVDVVKTYSGEFNDYKFYNKGNGVYQIKTDSGYDDITGLPLLTFTGEAATSLFKEISTIVDIKGTFDQITGLNTDSGRMFRLYNAAFARFPDSDGLKYWIDQYSSGANDSRTVAQSFLSSDEFAERYGLDISNEKYVATLYTNVLGRDYDQEGFYYWAGQLNSGAETRYEVLLGFAESAENKALFTDMTGFG